MKRCKKAAFAPRGRRVLKLDYGGSAEVFVSTRPRTLEVEVCDRGGGIDPKLRERVFDPFFRVEASRSRDTGGGLRVRVSLPL